MKSTMTLNELAEKVLGAKTSQELESVDFGDQDVEITLDQMAKRYLKPNVVNAISQVNLEIEELNLRIEVREFHASAHGKGLSILITMLILGSLVLGSGPLIGLIQLILGR